jgi:hypothetical protein
MKWAVPNVNDKEIDLIIALSTCTHMMWHAWLIILTKIFFIVASFWPCCRDDDLLKLDERITCITVIADIVAVWLRNWLTGPRRCPSPGHAVAAT